MDIEISKLLIPAAVGLLTGILGTFFAPWVNWGIEKRKLKRQGRVELISKVRQVLSEDVPAKEFRHHPIYSQIRPYLSELSIKNIEGSFKGHSEGDIIVVGSGRHGGVNPFRQRVLDEMTDLEKKWKLI